MATQKGISDCGLYTTASIAIYTYSLTNDDDPVIVVYKLQEMRINLQQCFENGVIQ